MKRNRKEEESHAKENGKEKDNKGGKGKMNG